MSLIAIKELPRIAPENQLFLFRISDPGMVGRKTVEFNSFQEVDAWLVANSQLLPEFKDYGHFDLWVLNKTNAATYYLGGFRRYTGYQALIVGKHCRIREFLLVNEPDAV